MTSGDMEDRDPYRKDGSISKKLLKKEVPHVKEKSLMK